MSRLIFSDILHVRGWQKREIKALQYIMGHSNAAVTLDVYTHVHEREIVEEEMTKMEKAM